MCWGDVQLMKDADGTEYLHFSERQTKTRSGADPRNVRPIKPKAFATPDLPRERDPVVVFKIYSEKRPESMNKPDAPFYLGVNHTTKNSDKSWFKASAMGVNKLNSLMKTMAERAGPTPTAAGLFKGAVFYGGNFTININSSSSSTEGHKKQTYKRIKRIFDSTDDDDSPPLT